MNLKNIEMSFSTIDDTSINVLLYAPSTSENVKFTNILFNQTTPVPVPISFYLLRSESGKVEMSVVNVNNMNYGTSGLQAFSLTSSESIILS